MRPHLYIPYQIGRRRLRNPRMAPADQLRPGILPNPTEHRSGKGFHPGHKADMGLMTVELTEQYASHCRRRRADNKGQSNRPGRC